MSEKIYSVITKGSTKITNIVPGTFTFQGEDVTVTDSYHTMDELYDHRRALTAALCKFIMYCDGAPFRVLRAKKHHDGTMFDGYFMVMIISHEDEDNPVQVSYHYLLKHWDEFHPIDEYEVCPFEYDGHTSEDVIKRLLSW